MKRDYTWISTNSADGKTFVVMAHHKTAALARDYAERFPHGGYEGPVPKDMYPIGKTLEQGTA